MKISLEAFPVLGQDSLYSRFTGYCSGGAHQSAYCISGIGRCYDHCPSKSNFAQLKGLCWLTVWRTTPTWWGSCGSETVRSPAVRTQRETNAGPQLPLSFSLQSGTPALGDITPIQDGPSFFSKLPGNTQRFVF